MENIRNKKHAEIALAVKSAKRAMFKRSREGVNLREAADRFISDVAVKFADIVPTFAADEYERNTTTTKRKPVSTMVENKAPMGAKRIPIIGTVGDHGIRLKPEYEDKEEIERAREEAKTVAAFLEGGPPDFLMEAILTAINEAFDHLGIPKPLASPGAPVGPFADYDEENLFPLFLRTKMLSWSDLWSDEERVFDASYTLLHNPKTPDGLFDAVADFFCEQSNRASVLGDELYHSEPILRLVLESVPPEELRAAAVAAARETEGSAKAN